MKKGEMIQLDSLSETEKRRVVKRFFGQDFAILEPRTIFSCRNCGTVVLRISMPNVEIACGPNEEPYCMKCKIKSGKSVEVETAILDF